MALSQKNTKYCFTRYSNDTTNMWWIFNDFITNQSELSTVNQLNKIWRQKSITNDPMVCASTSWPQTNRHKTVLFKIKKDKMWREIKRERDTTDAGNHLILHVHNVNVLVAWPPCRPLCSSRRYSPTFNVDFWKLVAVVVTNTLLTRRRLRYLLHSASTTASHSWDKSQLKTLQTANTKQSGKQVFLCGPVAAQWPCRYQLTTLGNLFTPMPLSDSSIIWNQWEDSDAVWLGN